MGMRPTFDMRKKLQADALVDKTVGNAYKTVEYVADNMERLLQLTPSGIEEIFTEGTVGLVGQTTLIPLPQGLDLSTVRSSLVQLRDVVNQFHTESEGNFTGILKADGLHVTLLPTAPLVMQNAQILWNITKSTTTDE